MKCIIIFAIIVVTAANPADIDRDQWMKFKSSSSKSYRNRTEETFRFSVFQSNLRKIEEHNEKYEKGQSSYKLGVTVFADLTEEEFMSRMMKSKRSKPRLDAKPAEIPYDGDLPVAVDWTKKGAVTPVKDQANCGSCWSFSTTGCIESQNFLKTGKLLSFSEQQLVDCASTCFGCDGGYLDSALEYVEANGLMLEDSYPYEAVDDKCRFNSSTVAVKIASFVAVAAGDERALQKAVATVGPISVAIEATMSFQLYESGVMDDPTCGNGAMELNHAVLAVGYGSLNGKDYWIVKNSWGSSWGQDGYLWMSRNANNQCGIATEPMYAVL